MHPLSGNIPGNTIPYSPIHMMKLFSKIRRWLQQPLSLTQTTAILVCCVTSGLWCFWPWQPAHQVYLNVLYNEASVYQAALQHIEDQWTPESALFLTETAIILPHREKRKLIFELMERKSGRKFDADFNKCYDWIWAQDYSFSADRVSEFRFDLYTALRHYDLAEYFTDRPTHLIPTEEIRFGGVSRDGVIPIRQPRMVASIAATDMQPEQIVFGIEINGDARAYPRRMLGHHEMVWDTVGGIAVTGVYCTLCEMMIFYDNTLPDGRQLRFGTSGFLYNSNKLMYDMETRSLWQTVEGIPVVGKMTQQNFKLNQFPVVTTTWLDWVTTHPDSLVLSSEDLPKYSDRDADTDYSEGAAYRDYFASPDLMFSVTKTDPRLDAKQEVFIPRLPSGKTIAFACQMLQAEPVYHYKTDADDIVIITTTGGANRAYLADGNNFNELHEARTVSSFDGDLWQIEEAGLNSGAKTLQRLPANRAFWFGWFAAHPDTELIW